MVMTEPVDRRQQITDKGYIEPSVLVLERRAAFVEALFRRNEKRISA